MFPNLTALDASLDIAWAVLGRGAAPRLQRLALVHAGVNMLRFKPGLFADMQRALACLIGRAGPVDLQIRFFPLLRGLLVIDSRRVRVERQIRCVTTLTISGYYTFDPVRDPWVPSRLPTLC